MPAGSGSVIGGSVYEVDDGELVLIVIEVGPRGGVYG